MRPSHAARPEGGAWHPLHCPLIQGEAMFQSISIKGGLGSANAEAVVFGYFGEKSKGLPLDEKSAGAAAKLGLREAVSQALSRSEATGDGGSVVEAFGPAKGGKSQRVLMVGLGNKDKFEAGGLRNA